MPKNDRGLLSKSRKHTGPSPVDYSNTNEIANSKLLRKIMCYTVGRSERKFDAPKFASIHSELVTKGLH